MGGARPGEVGENVVDRIDVRLAPVVVPDRRFEQHQLVHEIPARVPLGQQGAHDSAQLPVGLGRAQRSLQMPRPDDAHQTS
jgi:hypothetical protein